MSCHDPVTLRKTATHQQSVITSKQRVIRSGIPGHSRREWGGRMRTGYASGIWAAQHLERSVPTGKASPRLPLRASRRGEVARPHRIPTASANRRHRPAGDVPSGTQERADVAYSGMAGPARMVTGAPPGTPRRGTSAGSGATRRFGPLSTRRLVDQSVRLRRGGAPLGPASPPRSRGRTAPTTRRALLSDRRNKALL